MRRLLKLLGRMGKVDEIAPDHFFLRADRRRDGGDRGRRRGAGRASGEFIAAQFRDRLDNGRKVAIQILEFFDRHGVTLRRGDLRRINPHRLDLFGRPARETTQFWKRSVPGGASGLQIREGPRAGPWWVRLPLSSATFKNRTGSMTPLAPVRTDIVLVGGGHAHVHVLNAFAMLPEPGVRITLITRDLETPYSGMLPGVVAGLYRAAEAHIDLVRLAAATGTRLIHAEANGIDRINKRVELVGRPPIAYDILSVDVGITPALGGNRGRRRARASPSSRSARSWRKFEALREACRRPDGPRRIVVIGGGAGGVELMLSLRARLTAEAGSGFLLRAGHGRRDPQQSQCARACRLPPHPRRTQHRAA